MKTIYICSKGNNYSQDIQVCAFPLRDSLVSIIKGLISQALRISSAVVVFSVFWVTAAYSMTVIPTGVNSNFLIDNGRVFFAQADDSLTVLDLETGSVIARKKDKNYSGVLLKIKEGILVLNYFQITLLDSKTLTPIWKTDKSYNPNIIDGYLVSYDGDGLVECRSLDNGKVRWSYNLPGALDIVAEKGKVLVHNAARFFEGSPATVLLDLYTGEELFRKSPPPGIHYDNVYFDGERIYLEYESSSSNRFDNSFEKIVICNLSGREISSIDVPPGFEKSRGYSGEPFFSLGGKTFASGRVWGDDEEVPPAKPGRPLIERKYMANSKKEVIIYTFKIDSGSIIIEAVEDEEITIELKSEKAKWKGLLSYLKKRWEVLTVAEADNKLLLGTDLGYVECISMRSASSLWMYIFPTLHHPGPYGLNIKDSFMATEAKIWRRGNKRKVPSSGMRLLSQKENSKPRIIFDPNPWNPFHNLPLYFAIAWIGILFPIILLAVLFPIGQKYGLDSRILAFVGLTLSALSAFCFFIYRWVSQSSNVTSRVAILILMLFTAVFIFRAYRDKRWISATYILFLLIVFGVFVLPEVFYQ